MVRFDKVEILLILRGYKEFPGSYPAILEYIQERRDRLGKLAEDYYGNEPTKKLLQRIREKFQRLMSNPNHDDVDIRMEINNIAKLRKSSIVSTVDEEQGQIGARHYSLSPRGPSASQHYDSAGQSCSSSSTRYLSANPPHHSAQRHCQSSSPRRRSESPRRRSESPRRQSTSPPRQSTSPRHQSTSLHRRSESPRGQSASPRRRLESPRRLSTSPRRQSTSPRRRWESPRRHSESPRRRSVSPHRQSRSRSRRSRSRSRSPRPDARSPSRRSRSDRDHDVRKSWAKNVRSKAKEGKVRVTKQLRDENELMKNKLLRALLKKMKDDVSSSDSD